MSNTASGVVVLHLDRRIHVDVVLVVVDDVDVHHDGAVLLVVVSRLLARDFCCSVMSLSRHVELSSLSLDVQGTIFKAGYLSGASLFLLLHL